MWGSKVHRNVATLRGREPLGPTAEVNVAAIWWYFFWVIYDMSVSKKNLKNDGVDRHCLATLNEKMMTLMMHRWLSHEDFQVKQVHPKRRMPKERWMWQPSRCARGGLWDTDREQGGSSESQWTLIYDPWRINVCHIWWHLPSIYPSFVSICLPYIRILLLLDVYIYIPTLTIPKIWMLQLMLPSVSYTCSVRCGFRWISLCH